MYFLDQTAMTELSAGRAAECWKQHKGLDMWGVFFSKFHWCVCMIGAVHSEWEWTGWIYSAKGTSLYPWRGVDRLHAVRAPPFKQSLGLRVLLAHMSQMYA